MLQLILIVSVIVSSCVFGSISDFSEEDIKDKENIVFNPGFEKGETAEDAMPLFWMTLDNDLTHINWDNVNRYEGTRCLHVENPGKKINIVSETFPINPEYVYYTRCYMKTNYYSNHQAYIRFVAFNEKGKRVNKFSEKIYPEEEWTKGALTTGFFNPKARFGRIIISIPDREDKEFWIDNVESYQVYRIQK